MTYVWNDELQKKVKRRRCVGKFDLETGKVIPNGKAGRPSVKAKARPVQISGQANDKKETSYKKASPTGKLRNDQDVSTEVLTKICAALDCEVQDIVDFFPRKSLENQNDSAEVKDNG